MAEIRESRSRMHRLIPSFVATVKTKGMYFDGGGLYLQVGDGGRAKSWIFRYHVKGRGDRQIGLGSAIYDWSRRCARARQRMP
jgi:hypothetical protein